MIMIMMLQCSDARILVLGDWEELPRIDQQQEQHPGQVSGCDQHHNHDTLSDISGTACLEWSR